MILFRLMTTIKQQISMCLVPLNRKLNAFVGDAAHALRAARSSRSAYPVSPRGAARPFSAHSQKALRAATGGEGMLLA